MAKEMPTPPPGKEDYVYICRPFITRKGVRIFAHQVGLKAFCFWVPADRAQS